MQTEIPRLSHNRKIMDRYLADNGVKSSVPPVSEQAKTVICTGIQLHSYNPTIMLEGDKIIMAYRYHVNGSVKSDLGFCEMSSDLKCYGAKVLVTGNEGYEDPRFIRHQDKILIAYVKSNFGDRQWKSSIQLLDLASGMEKSLVSPYDKPIEKNWVPFVHNDELLFIYDQYPTIHIIDQDSKLRYETKGFRWKWGFPKGGTTPVPFGEHQLRFFHSTLDNEMRPWFRRYYIGAVVTKCEPPFEVVAVSKKPILQGSEVGGGEAAKFFKGNVVFPAGCVKRDDEILLSVGINDCECQIVKLTPEELNL